jgi:hypothetical protein
MLLCVTLVSATSFAQAPQPSLSALFPAGGKRGSAVEVTLNGANLTNALSARVSGGGVTAEVVQPVTANSAKLRLTIAPDAELGERDLRLATSGGVSNRVRFVVGDLPEVNELEPNTDLKQPQRIASLPAVVNGQINTAEDVDNFLFTAQAGQTLTFDVYGQRLAPYLPINPGPGWFETCLTLYNASGKELKFVDDFYYRPDAQLTYTFAQTGDYVIQVRDLTYRSHPQFVYRLTVNAAPADRSADNMVTSSIGQTLPMPVIPISFVARIERDGEEGVFSFPAQAGQRLIFEVKARRLDSPLDSVLEILNAQGNVIASNDDAMGQDSRIDFTFPSAGTFTVRVKDAIGRGGKDYFYRLTVRPPAPDFELTVTPDNPRVGRGETVVLTVNVNRKEGFADDIELGVSGLPVGVSASCVTVLTNQNQARLTITTSNTCPIGITPLLIFGTANVNQQAVTCQATAQESVIYVDQPRQLPVREVVLSVIEPTHFSLTADYAAPRDRILRLRQNTKENVVIKVQRKPGVTGVINLTIEGLPKGVTATIAPIPADQNQVTMTLSATAEAEPRTNSTLIITGTATVNGQTVTRYVPAITLRINPA